MASASLPSPYTGRNEIRVGDVVELKSGGVPMTVDSIGDGLAKCIWQEGSTHHSQLYRLVVLRPRASGFVLFSS